MKPPKMPTPEQLADLLKFQEVMKSAKLDARTKVPKRGAIILRRMYARGFDRAGEWTPHHVSLNDIAAIAKIKQRQAWNIVHEKKRV